MHNSIETERRFFIEYPNAEELLSHDGAFSADITQIYLTTDDPCMTARVRRMVRGDSTHFFKTVKTRISSCAAIEDEREISEADFNSALANADPSRRAIEKTRITVPYRKHNCEIDIYPFWHDRAVMEIELSSEKEQISLPPFVSVIREITGESAYSNHSLSFAVPTGSPLAERTTRLFDIDSHLFEFSSHVIASERLADGTCDTVLAASAFFPSGGGQSFDLGSINGVTLLRVFEKDGIIHHITERCIGDGSLAVCQLDRARRLSAMQAHSGEHIVSGIAHRRFGCNNVGFHMGEDYVTLDLDKYITGDEINELEYAANSVVWRNERIFAYYPSASELSSIDYRSKLELEHNVRLVEIENTDICACCAPHVKRTGEIGLIRLFDFEKYKGGVRIYMHAGMAALASARESYDILAECARTVSASPKTFKRAFDTLNSENAKLKYELVASRRRLADALVKSSCPKNAVYFENSFDSDDMKYITDTAIKSGAETAAVFALSGDSLRFAVEAASSEYDLKQAAAHIVALGMGKCGGNRSMIRGTLSCDTETAQRFFTDPENLKHSERKD